LIEWFCIHKHGVHISYITNIPAANVLIK
jgi:hypothetical protein